jgi:HPt (histidine-containing phosphotransfer) domain-containing protein
MPANPVPQEPATAGGPLTSVLSTDPDMAEIVAEFASEMPGRIEQLTKSWDQQQLDVVQRLSHQLKGAAGGYGFPQISDAAGKLEQSLVALSGAGLESDIARLRTLYGELVSLCKRVRA